MDCLCDSFWNKNACNGGKFRVFSKCVTVDNFHKFSENEFS